MIDESTDDCLNEVIKKCMASIEKNQSLMLQSLKTLNYDRHNDISKNGQNNQYFLKPRKIHENLTIVLREKIVK